MDALSALFEKKMSAHRHFLINHSNDDITHSKQLSFDVEISQIRTGLNQEIRTLLASKFNRPLLEANGNWHGLISTALLIKSCRKLSER
jgi:hypothetical protein